VAGEVYKKSLEMRHFRALAYPEEPKRGPSRAPKPLGRSRMKRTAATADVGRRIGAAQNVGKGIRAYTLETLVETPTRAILCPAAEVVHDESDDRHGSSGSGPVHIWRRPER